MLSRNRPGVFFLRRALPRRFTSFAGDGTGAASPCTVLARMGDRPPDGDDGWAGVAGAGAAAGAAAVVAGAMNGAGAALAARPLPRADEPVAPTSSSSESSGVLALDSSPLAPPRCAASSRFSTLRALWPRPSPPSPLLPVLPALPRRRASAAASTPFPRAAGRFNCTVVSAAAAAGPPSSPASGFEDGRTAPGRGDHVGAAAVACTTSRVVRTGVRGAGRLVPSRAFRSRDCDRALFAAALPPCADASARADATEPRTRLRAGARRDAFDSALEPAKPNRY